MKIVLSVVLFLFSIIGFAQDVEMADTIRSEGKIYIVVAILSVILVGLFLYLISIDKKVGNLEKEIKK
jgi:CcmD family protein